MGGALEGARLGGFGQFAPFDQEDSVEGYMEFNLRYPLNRHGYKASVKIEQSELKRYERIDSKEGYQEFLAKYPESNFAVLAKERLQELEFRQLDVLLREKYGFDLPLYRLYLKRLKKTLGTERGLDLGAYTFFASIVTLEKKKYFHTHFIYATDISYLYTTAAETSDTFFDRLVSPAVAYLGDNFKAQDKIDGLSFDIAWSAHSYHGDRHIMRAYYFPVRAALLFASDKLDKDGLLAQSVISGAEKVSPEQLAPHLPQPQSAAINSGYETGADEVLDGMRIMTIVAERNRGDDSIIASSWQRGRHTMKDHEKHQEEFRSADVSNIAVLSFLLSVRRLLVDLLYFIRHFGLDLARGLLEFADSLPEALGELGDLLRAEEDQDNEKDEKYFRSSEVTHTVPPPASCGNYCD